MKAILTLFLLLASSGLGLCSFLVMLQTVFWSECPHRPVPRAAAVEEAPCSPRPLIVGPGAASDWLTGVSDDTRAKVFFYNARVPG